MGKIFERQVMDKGQVCKELNMKTGLVNHKSTNANNSSFLRAKRINKQFTHIQREREMAKKQMQRRKKKQIKIYKIC